MRHIVQPPARVVGVGRRFLQRCVSGDHLPWNQILADAEMFERALRLRPPKLVTRNPDCTQAVTFCSKVDHRSSPPDALLCKCRNFRFDTAISTRTISQNSLLPQGLWPASV